MNFDVVGGSGQFPSEQRFPPKCSRARWRLATLPTARFGGLSGDVFYGLSWWCPGFGQQVYPTGGWDSASAVVGCYQVEPEPAWASAHSLVTRLIQEKAFRGAGG